MDRRSHRRTPRALAAEQVSEAVIYATPLGLLLDIAGVVMLFVYGHYMFLHTGPLFAGDEQREEERRQDRIVFRKRRLARWGLGLLVIGFALQIVGWKAG